MKNPNKPNTSRVFVIHGRNEEMRRALFDFLRAIDLKPIEWSEAVTLTGKPSPFVSEILDAAMHYAQAIIVFFTGDDEVRLKEEFLWVNDPVYEREATPQSRPNVIFEAEIVQIKMDVHKLEISDHSATLQAGISSA